MGHPHIVPVRKYVIEHSTAFIISDYIQGGEYFDRIVLTKNITDKSVARTITQILSAINYAATKGVYHLDLKPENILLEITPTQYNVKIVDFGLNKYMG